MPITRYIQNRSFTAKEVKVIAAAFDGACQELGLVDRSDPIVEIVATQLIDLAAAGERNPIRLQNSVVAKIRM
jgi:hypothetical protein